MKTDEDNPMRGNLERLIAQKILPFINNKLGYIPSGLPELIGQHSYFNTFIKDQFMEETGDFKHGHMFFMHSGVARVYYYDESREKIITIHIAKKDEVLIDSDSFNTGATRPHIIQMIEAGSALSISYVSLKFLLQQFPELQFLQLLLLAERQKQSIYYQYLLKLPLQERIEVYLAHNPGITSRINNDYISSYLSTHRTRFSKAYAIFKRKRESRNTNIKDRKE